MHVKIFQYFWLGIFEKAIQDPRNIEHFIQVCMEVSVAEKCPLIEVLLHLRNN